MGWRCPGCVQRLLPRSDLPGAKQPTPCGLNRYVLLLIYSFYVFVTGCVYMGWTPLATMILRAGGFSWLCTPEAAAFIEGAGEQFAGVCNEQEAAVQKLYTLTLAVHCSSSAFAGTLVDFAGPRLTALLGQALSFAGWCLLASTTPTSRYTLPAAFVLIGVGVDTSVLPHLCITRLFPGSAGLIITITGSASSASMFVPLILDSFGGHDLKVCWVYAFVAPGMMFFVALFLFPFKNFAVDEGPAENTKPRQPSEGKEDSLSEHKIAHMSITNAETVSVEPQLEPPPSISLSDFIAGGSPNKCEQSCQEKKVETVGVKTCNSPNPGATGESGRFRSFSGFWRQVFSERYMLIVLYFVGVVWASSFYQQSPRRTFSESVVRFLEVLLPLSFIPCIVLGKVADVWGIVQVMLGLNFCGVLMYALAMIKVEAAGYASVVFFCFYMSLFMGQVFVYVDATFAPQHFGKLVGLAAMVGGLLSLACNLLYGVAVDGGARGLFICQITMFSLLMGQFVVLGRLYFLFRKNPHPYRSSVSTRAPMDNGAAPEVEENNAHTPQRLYMRQQRDEAIEVEPSLEGEDRLPGEERLPASDHGGSTCACPPV